VVAFIGMAVGFVVLTYGLWLRWQIAGRIPAANMFESLLFLSWGAGAFAIVSLIVLRDRFVPLTASVMGATALILADRLPIDQFVRPIVPVLLDTIWMSIHVPIIMVSYAVLSVAVLIAHAQLVLMALRPGRRDLAERIDWLHYWYAFIGSFLLLAGIITGSMWGASSWGRYWGWDPKEVWSLVAFLGYMVILHVRVNHERTPGWAYGVAAVLGVGVAVAVVPHLLPLTSVKLGALAATAFAALVFVLGRGPFAAALKSTLAFWLIIMTYVGVNYVLGIGLHSYGFGTGAVARKMFIVGGIDLGLIGLCAVVYLARRPPQRPAAISTTGSDRR
jgi:ABC-type transport system involved in cytochrome c biogenesis permease subunit